jgi:hypothetical protein
VNHNDFLEENFLGRANFAKIYSTSISKMISEHMEIPLEVTKENGKLFLGVYLNHREDHDPLTDIEIYAVNKETVKKMYKPFLDITETTGCGFNIFLFYRNE